MGKKLGMDDLGALVVFVSYSVIFLSLFIKIPQILALYSAGTSRCVSPRGYWMEIAW